MFSDCYIVFRRVTRRRRTGSGVRVEASYEPAYVAEDYGAAARFRDALTEETGEPAQMGRARLWKGAGDGGA